MPNMSVEHGSVPSSWLGITDDWRPSVMLGLLARVRAAGVALDDLEGVRRIWQAMQKEEQDHGPLPSDDDC